MRGADLVDQVSPTAVPDPEAAAVGTGLRIAVAATGCLLVSEWWHLEQTALSVYSVHLAMVSFPFSAFQKVVERIGGRLLGVFYGLVLVEFFLETPLLFLVLLVLGLLAFFYVNASGRVAYAALMGGLFLGVIALKGIIAPASASHYAAALVPQLLLAGFMSFLVNWVSGAERTMQLITAGEPWWPPRASWLNKSAMVTTAMAAAMGLAFKFDLPELPTLISATILGVSSPDPRTMGHKAVQRALGAVLGGGLALGAIILLVLLLSFVLLLVLVFAGMFLAAYLSKFSVTNSYTYLQMGMVLPMVLLGSTGAIGTIDTAVQRLIGVGAGLLSAEVVFLLWPHPRGSYTPHGPY